MWEWDQVSAVVRVLGAILRGPLGVARKVNGDQARACLAMEGRLGINERKRMWGGMGEERYG